MWIRHGHALYNSNDISEIKLCKTTIRARFISDGEAVILGSFNTPEKAEGIFRNIMQALLYQENPNAPGIMITDDPKPVKEKKNVGKSTKSSENN